MFGAASLKRLNECDARLQAVFSRVGQEINCTILYGHRTDEEQAALFEKGLSKKGPGESMHNRKPSLAIDVAPWPIDWADLPPRAQWTPDTLTRWMKQRARYYMLAGVAKGIALELGIKLRWGGDWDGDYDFNDQTFDDLVHFEIVG